MKRIFILIISLGLIVLFGVSKQYVSADSTPYGTYTYNESSKMLVATQAAYVPLSIQYDLGGIEIKNPEDITIDKDNNIYIVDSEIKGILKYNLETNESSIIGQGILINPTGVHVGVDNKIYVADFGTKEGYQFTYNNDTLEYEVTNVYKKPLNTPYFNTNSQFEPTKIVTDHANMVYIVLGGSYSGMAKFNEKAEFTGFFGGNELPRTLENMIKTFLFDEQQRREWFKMIPKPVHNVAVDDDGLILTTTKTEDGYKKLNIASQVFNESSWGLEDTEDLFVGPNQTIFAVSKEGYIIEYSPEGETLFIFSGTDTYGQKGLLKSPSGIAVDSRNNIYVIDSGAKALQIFVPTEFADTVHEAIVLYYQGKYSESLEPWQKVLKMNNLFDLANKGIGDAHFAQTNYELAMESYIKARYTEGYSQAFWEVRNVMLLENGALIVSLVLGFIILMILNTFFKFTRFLVMPFKKLHKVLTRFKIYNELLYGFTIFRKPSDGFYGIKRSNKSSNLTAIILILLFFLSYIFWRYNTNFLFSNTIPSEINMSNEIMLVFLPIILWVFSNYLIGSIRDGEGKLSDVLQGTAYILLPLTIAFPILAGLSHVVTLNEGFVYTSILYVAVGLTIIYLVIMVKEIHFYDMKPTFANILISIFTAVMILVFILIVYILLGEVVGLFSDIIKEVSNRV